MTLICLPLPPPPLSVSIYHIFIVYPHSVQMHPSPSLCLIIPLVECLCGQIAALSMKSSSKREGTAVTASMCYWVFARVLLSVWCVSSPVHARVCVSRPISEGLIDRLKDSVCHCSASLAQVLESVCAHDSVCVCVYSQCLPETVHPRNMTELVVSGELIVPSMGCNRWR